MKCKNCDVEIGKSELRDLENIIRSMETKLYELKLKRSALKSGFCDGYCENNYHEGF